MLRLPFFLFLSGTTLSPLVLGGCGGPAPVPSHQEVAQKIVGSEGGSINMRSGTELDVPAGALTQEVEVILTETEEFPQPPASGFAQSGEALVLEPHGQAFDEPLTLTIHFDRDPNVPIDRYQTMRLRDEQDTTWEIVENAFPDEKGTVEFTIQTFSVIAVVLRDQDCRAEACAANEALYAERFLNCIGSGRTSDYCAGWIGCAGELSVGGQHGTLVVDRPLCDDACETNPCVNGTCTNDGATPACLCNAGFEGELCDIETDLCPGDDNKLSPGACGCSVADLDSDGDGTLDCFDGCGVSDADTDLDGSPDCSDGCLEDPAKSEPGVCGCGLSDADNDADGAADCEDLCPDDAAKSEPGVCGCGVADTDSDADGAADCEDLCPDDATKLAPGECGCGVPESSCAAVCPCFDSAIVTDIAANGMQCWIDSPEGPELTSGAFGEASLAYLNLDVRTQGSDYSCSLACNTGNDPSACDSYTIATEVFSDQESYNACRQLLVDTGFCGP